MKRPDETHNPIIVSKYRGYGYAVTCERAGGPDSKWVFWVDVFKDQGRRERALPTRHDHDHSYAILVDAQNAGHRMAKGLIDSLAQSVAR